MLWLLACISPDVPQESTPPDAVDSAAPFTDTDPWPGGSSWDASVSLITSGQIVANGSTLSVDAAPAGVDHEATLALVLTNRTDEALTLEGWDLGPFHWVDTPASTLGPQESTPLTLAFQSANYTEGGSVEHTLRVPETDYEVVLQANVPGPLRLVLVGDGGFSLASTDYGATWTESPATSERTMMAAAWGDGVFIRGMREGGWSSEVHYDYSTDGLNWSDASVASGGWPFACAYGDGRFVCVRDYGGYTSWSQDGQTFIHEVSPGASTFLQAIVFSDGHFVAAGRDGTISVGGYDGLTAVHADGALGDYNAIASGDGRLVAVGGWRQDQYLISTSTDGGWTWTSTTFAASAYASLSSVAYANGIWVLQGRNNSYANMLRSTDGETWDPIETDIPSGGWQLMGSHNGWFIGLNDDRIARSQDGLSWETTHTLPEDTDIVAMAAERWP